MNHTSRWQDIEVLIAVKAYPNTGETGMEACCTAGITADGHWLRLYPIYYRTMPEEQRFKKYDVVRMKVRRLKSDPRPESMEVLESSIQRVRHVGPEGNWGERRLWVDKSVDESMCSIMRKQKTTGKSMGAFRPAVVNDVEITRRDESESPEERAVQLTLLDPQWRPLPPVPYRFRLCYQCTDPGCRGHSQTIVDWEASQLYWRLVRDGRSPDEICAAIRKRILEDIFSPRNDTLVFCGNIKKYPASFIIGGFFYPKIVPRVPSLFDDLDEG